VVADLCRLLVEQLASVDPSHLSHDEKLAFWINLYNTLMMDVRIYCMLIPFHHCKDEV